MQNFPPLLDISGDNDQGDSRVLLCLVTRGTCHPAPWLCLSPSKPLHRPASDLLIEAIGSDGCGEVAQAA